MKNQFLHSIMFCLVFLFSNIASAQNYDVWIGTEGRNGVFHARFNSDKGELSEPKKVATQHGAGFLAVDSGGKNLYVTARNEKQGSVISYSISSLESGDLAVQNTGVSRIPGGHHPAHVSLDRNQNFVFAAQYGGGSIAVFKINENGSVGELTSSIEHQGGSEVVKNRQDRPHPHWIGVDSTNSFVAVPDLGMDQVVTYKFDARSGKLETSKPWILPPGSGPRHMKFHENGRFAYVLNEFTMTVSVFKLDSAGGSKSVQEIKSLPDELRDDRLNTCAEIRIHPNGRFLYTSNRGHDSISVFAIDSGTGRLTNIERESIRGSWPRNFAISPDGKWLIAAGKFSNTLSLFEVKSTGELEFTRTIKNMPQPICVAFSPSEPSSRQSR